MNLPKNHFKAALARGERLIGLWSALGSPVVAEILGDGGYDWIALDTEHTPSEPADILAQLQAVAGSGTSVIARPAWNDAVLIKRLLDVGVQTMLVPYVQNEAEARAAVAATRYPPEGVRGVTGMGRAARYGRLPRYLQQAAAEIAVIVQIETKTALDNLEAIASVPGVDAVFIGPADLSASMGHLGNPGHTEVQGAIKDAAARLNALGRPAGILSFDPPQAQQFFTWGFQFIAVGADLTILTRGMADLLTHFRSANGEN